MHHAWLFLLYTVLPLLLPLLLPASFDVNPRGRRMFGVKCLRFFPSFISSFFHSFCVRVRCMISTSNSFNCNKCSTRVQAYVGAVIKVLHPRFSNPTTIELIIIIYCNRSSDGNTKPVISVVKSLYKSCMQMRSNIADGGNERGQHSEASKIYMIHFIKLRWA